MKENGGMTRKMLNRDWVLKRKRKKIPCSIDITSGKGKNVKHLKFVEPPSVTSSKQRPSKGITFTQSASKKKGNDGYYYECVICNLGGKLLCCDSCPRTYHIQCLEPPLKRIPTGEWHCPNCFKKSDSTPIDHLEPITKRARTRITIRNLKTDNSSGLNKLPQIFGSFIPGKRRSSSKEKSPSHPSGLDSETKLDSFLNDMSSEAKSSCPSRGCSMEDRWSSQERVDNKKAEVSSSDTPIDKKSMSPPKEVVSLCMVKNAKMEEGTSEGKPDFASDTRSVIRRHFPDLDAATRIARKRKHKVDGSKSKKKHIAEKGKFAANNSQKCGHNANAISPGTTKLQVEDKTGPLEAYASLSTEDVDMEVVDAQINDKTVLEEAAHPSDELHATGKIEVDVTSLDVTPVVQQVDRILGCRVQGDDVNPSCNVSLIYADDPLEELVVPEEKNKLFGENPSDISYSGMSPEDFGQGSQDIASDSVAGMIIENDSREDKLVVYRRSVKKDCKHGIGLDSMIRVGENYNTSSSNTNNEDDPSENVKNTITRKNTREESSILESRCNCDVPKISEVPLSNEVAETRTEDFTMPACEPSNGSPISYEFLVKWVGRSHIHNTWVPETELKLLAKRKLDYYKGRYGTTTVNFCEEHWKQPQRVIAARSSRDGLSEVFVKWFGLPYDECTWERIDEPVIEKSLHLIDLFNKFERQTLEKDSAKLDPIKRREIKQNELVTLTVQPKELKGGALYPHQLEALNWLRKCWHKSKNVILADEMGLGKTVSASAYIASLYFEFKVTLPCLVLVPLTTMPNWMSEFALWAPDLNVVEYHGSAKARSIIREHEWHAVDPNGLKKKTAAYKFDVLLTTYEMVLTDTSHLRAIPWEVLVVDEGHRLKNNKSKLFSLLNTISFQHRVLLTGTPLQNNIGELYNLLNFLQPASFPSLSSFLEKFNDLTNAEKVEELKKLVAPHMLRRLKKDAAQNIPPKIERMVPVELSSIQAECYRAMLTKNYDILRNIGKGVAPKSILNVVMELRKVCNHPYLIPGTEPESGSVEFLHEMRIKASAKLTLLHSMLKLLHKEGHRVLIFSQMTKLLDILEDYLTVEFGPKTFERVDGSVSVADRQAAIARFNQDKSRFVFLLSTRACGLGINLATADTVIIYDSDFNPHADIQAMNRAHRIGQSNRLLVYRFFVRASVEERILQLTKKKLMLEQVFADKSQCPKEVEDILQWGTEELFSNSSSGTRKDVGENPSSKVEDVTESEQKHKRRTGCLGDVYEDKCTVSCNKIVWDENAILKLLDRSNLQSGLPDDTEAEANNDMLGSVKSVEWNDDQAEEEAKTASDPLLTDTTNAQNSEKKEENLAVNAEESAWDKLLRVRWEKYQTEVEESLGRGKRQRKAISYREAYAPHFAEMPSERGKEDEPEAEREREREYTPAGRALKVKFAKLRARQKERLAKRANGICLPPNPRSLAESSQVTPSHAESIGQMTPPLESDKEKHSSVDVEDRKCAQIFGGPKSKMDSTSRLGKMLNHKSRGHLECYLDCSLSNHTLHTSYMNNIASNLSPVLGLYAPNANQMESTQRNFSRSINRHAKQTPEFLAIPSSAISSEVGVEGYVAVSGKHKFPDLSSDASQQQRKSSVRDNRLPFEKPPEPVLFGNDSGNHFEKCGAMFADLKGKMTLPKFRFDDKLLQRFQFPAESLPPPTLESFPSLSLGSRVFDYNNSIPAPPAMPLMPDLKFPHQDASTSNQQEQERLPTLGLGQMAPSFSSFPESHKRVLENIMMKTGSQSSSLLKKKSKMDFWSEDELDNLWIGVRRHGRGNWVTMLQDKRLKFSKFRTTEDLSARWEEEQLKILDGPPLPMPEPLNQAKSSLFSGISDGMMTRALNGSKFKGLQKFQSHLTDMKLGMGSLNSSFPHFQPSGQLGLHTDHIPPLPSWNADKFQASLSKELAAGPSDRFNPYPLQPEVPLLPNSVGMSSLDSLGLNSSSYFELQTKENEHSAKRLGKLPSLLDRSLNLLRDANKNAGHGAFSSLLSNYDGQNFPLSMGHNEGAAGSAQNKLPHWLQEAVNAPPQPSEADLPPTVSAIAQSVRVLYGEEKSTIPPFVVPGPPPSQPKDPRWRLKKKKRRSHRNGSLAQDFCETSTDFRSIASASVSGNPLFPPFPKLAVKTLEESRITPNTIIPSLDLNMGNSSSTPVNPTLKIPTTMGLTPSPKVLELVASCVAPGPPPGTTSSSIHHDGVLPQSTSADKGSLEPQSIIAGHQAKQSSPLRRSDPLAEATEEKTESGDSCKTQSDLAGPVHPDVEELLSEGTVSDHPSSDNES